MKRVTPIGKNAGTRSLYSVVTSRKAVVCNGQLMTEKTLKEEWWNILVVEQDDRCKTLDPREPIGNLADPYSSPYNTWAIGSHRPIYFRDFVEKQTGLYLYEDVLYDSAKTIIKNGSIIAVPINKFRVNLTLDINTVVVRVGTSVAVKRKELGYRNN